MQSSASKRRHRQSRAAVTSSVSPLCDMRVCTLESQSCNDIMMEKDRARGDFRIFANISCRGDLTSVIYVLYADDFLELDANQDCKSLCKC